VLLNFSHFLPFERRIDILKEGLTKIILEVEMAVTRRGGRRKGDAEKITIQGERDKEQEVVVRHETVPEKKAGSVWSWYEEFTAELNETYITKKKRGKPKRGI
jgi:hypothetical protein